jgi:hypothetical protein
MRFSELSVGQHFTFDNSVSDKYASTASMFNRVGKKISARCYTWAGKRGVRVMLPRGWETVRMRTGLNVACVGSVSVKVIPGTRRSPVKKRKGIHRGKGKFSGR